MAEQEKGLKGNSKDAIVNSEINLSVRKEKSIEIIMKMMQAITSGDLNNVKPFVIGAKDGQLIVEECITNEDGTISLPDVKVNSREDIDVKSKFVRRIVKELTPMLHADIEHVTYIALMRKDAKKLEKMLKELKNKKHKPKLENRAGCIWVIVGDEEFIL